MHDRDYSVQAMLDRGERLDGIAIASAVLMVEDRGQGLIEGGTAFQVLAA